MGKIAYTFSMMRASWEVLKQDKELLLFPLFSSICCLLVMASFAIPMIATDSWQLPGQDAAGIHKVAYYAVLFLFYFCNYFVIIFFNSAIVACAIFRMRGGNPTVSTGLSAAMARLPQIAGWALVAATVSLVLRAIENSNKKVGRIVAGILGMAWSLVTFLVVPVLVVERKGPFMALKESTRLLKKTWGEQLIGGFSFGLIFLLLAIPGIGLFVLGVTAGSVVLTPILIVAGVLYLILLGLVQSTLQTIFQAAVYLYAKDGRAPAGFDEGALSASMHPR